MSLWKIGADDVSEETQQMKDKLASRDGQIAGQHSLLMKQAQEFEEMKISFNEALHKLAEESERALRLESELTRCKEDLRNEKINTRNVQTALDSANNKLKAKDLDSRDLESTLERLSRMSDDHNARATKLEREKGTLESRIRELESNIRQLQSAANSGTNHRVVSHPPSSQSNDFNPTVLEKQLTELQCQLMKKDSELEAIKEKLSQMQEEILRFDNEKIASEAKTKSQLGQLQAQLQEKEEELAFYRNQLGDDGREEELLRRIEEDEAKIGALEALLKQSQDSEECKDKLRDAEQRLEAEAAKVSSLELYNLDLIRGKEEALDKLETARARLHILEGKLKESQERLDNLVQERSRSVSAPSEPIIDPQNTPAIFDNTDPSVVVSVERLLNAIDRLRGERDDLRRSLHFLETEHKFTVDALEQCLADVSGGSSTTPGRDTAENSPSSQTEVQLESDSPPAQFSCLKDAEFKSNETRRLAHSAATYAILLLHSQTQLEQCNRHLSESLDREHYERGKCSILEEEAHQVSRQLEELNDRLKDSETRLEVTVLCLEAMTSQRDDLVSQLEAMDAEWEESKTSRRCLQDQLERMKSDLEEGSRTFEVVESERDSLALQVANLTADLKLAQDELTDAESRYSTLQFHQLSSMSSNEATHALRGQIAELEARVMRRTEQIGIHQHDIRRLETNLRLQEERLAEMTMELETLAAQKDAMVEDCADAREARDEALSQIDALEVELESSESKLADGADVLTSLICACVQTGAQAKSYAQNLKQSRSRVAKLEKELSDQRIAQHSLKAHLSRLQASSTEDTRQGIVALAVTQLGFNKAVAHLRRVAEENQCLVKELAVASQRAEEQENANQPPIEERITLHHSSSLSMAQPTEHQAGAEVKKAIFEFTTRGDGSQHQDTSLTAALREECQNLLTESQSGLAETNDLQSQLSTMTATLEEERKHRATLERKHVEALSEAQSHVGDLEKRMAVLGEELSQLRLSQTCLKEGKEKNLLELESLHVQLEGLLTEKAEAQKAQLDSATLIERLSEENSMLQKEREEIATAKLQADERQQKLEIENARLQTEIDELACSMESTRQEIHSLTQELEQERARLQDARNRHTEEIQLLSRERESVDSVVSALQNNIVALQTTVERHEASLVESEEEKGRLQENITALEAQIQKSLSYALSLERQIQDGDRAAETIKTQLTNAQLELSRAQTSAKTAEMNLSLQSAQFKRELAQLQGKLAALESRPKLEEALANLEERNNEMEELLRAKCTEIEENDDRALEMLKENKKLLSKVEGLTRKVQNLQTKLAAAKATLVPKSSMEPASVASRLSPQHSASTVETRSPATRLRSSRLSTGTPASLRSERLLSTAVSKPLTSRTVSGPPTLRPRTPEKRLATTPVFRLRTPEQHRVQERIPDLPPSVAGVKRRAPDDFEACESVPPQGFTTESIPSRENESTTPRVRRMLSNLQSGFTPIRGKVLSSPRRQATVSTPLIQDVTNSPRANGLPDPHSAKQSKRSWLGKIRGATSQTSVKSASRPVFTFMGEAQ